MKNSRYSAVDVLCRWQQSAQAIDPILEQAVVPLTDLRDRQLLKAIVFGVLRNYSLLDWVVAKYAKQPLKKIKNPVLQALRVGIYQLLFMDRVPPSAAINETIKALKSLKQPRWITGFANGVLRNVDRQKADLLQAINSGAVPPRARQNHPDWLIERWQKRYGSSRLEELCRSNNAQARLCLRVNSSKISVADFSNLLSQQEIEFSLGQYVHEAVWLSADAGQIEKLPGYIEGYFSVQDETAQLLCCLLGPFDKQAKGTYVDGCAGLGGKTTVMAQLVPEGSQVVAVEPTAQRLMLLGQNIDRLGVGAVEVFKGTLQEFTLQENKPIQAVLVDAPCSGLGVTGRHPDIRWIRKHEDLPRYQEKQLELLHAAASLVGSGGVVVYATCSIEPEENDEVVEKFLKENVNFKLENAGFLLSQQCQCLVDDKGFLRTVPGDEISDGFFAARLMRND